MYLTKYAIWTKNPYHIFITSSYITSGRDITL